MQRVARSVLREGRGVPSSGVRCGLRGVCGSCVFLDRIQATGGTCCTAGRSAARGRRRRRGAPWCAWSTPCGGSGIAWRRSDPRRTPPPGTAAARSRTLPRRPRPSPSSRRPRAAWTRTH
uniref:Uncharacterized protein n=1 Tax=Triticum urartu TaxID=4572 RepID=A0A8R7V0Z8_TRIUA